MKRNSRSQKMRLPARPAIRPRARRAPRQERGPPTARPGSAGPGALASSVVTVTSGPCRRCSAPAVNVTDDVGVEPGVDGRLLRAPGVRVDRLGLDRGQRRQRRQRVDARDHRVVQRVAGRVAGLHDLLAGRRQHELDELLRLGLLGGERLGVDADRARQQGGRVEVLDGRSSCRLNAAPMPAEHCTSARLIWPLVSACSVGPLVGWMTSPLDLSWRRTSRPG